LVDINGFAADSIGVSGWRGLDGGFRIVVAGEAATLGDAGTAVAFIGDLSIALRG
jgi:hypothetical protein